MKHGILVVGVVVVVVAMKVTSTGVGFVMRYSSHGAKIRIMGYECTIDGISIILRSPTVPISMQVNNKRLCLYRSFDFEPCRYLDTFL